MFYEIFNKKNLKRRLAQVVRRLNASFNGNTMRVALALLRSICNLIFSLLHQIIFSWIFAFLKCHQTPSIKSAPNHAPKKKRAKTSFGAPSPRSRTRSRRRNQLETNNKMSARWCAWFLGIYCVLLACKSRRAVRSLACARQVWLCKITTNWI